MQRSIQYNFQVIGAFHDGPIVNVAARALGGVDELDVGAGIVDELAVGAGPDLARPEVAREPGYDISDYIDLGIDAFYAQTGDFMSEMSDFTSEMMQEMSDSLRDLMEEMGLDGLSDNAVSVNREMDPADLKMMKIKHRNKEMKDIVKADAEYLKAVFDRLEKMKDNPVIPSGGGVSLSAGSSGTSFSADAAGIGAQVAPAPVIDISL